jgi:hypothetical protein
VFGFVLFAIEVFAFFPLARHLVRRRSLPLHLGITVLLFLTATGVLTTRDRCDTGGHERWGRSAGLTGWGAVVGGQDPAGGVSPVGGAHDDRVPAVAPEPSQAPGQYSGAVGYRPGPGCRWLLSYERCWHAGRGGSVGKLCLYAAVASCVAFGGSVWGDVSKRAVSDRIHSYVRAGGQEEQPSAHGFSLFLLQARLHSLSNKTNQAKKPPSRDGAGSQPGVGGARWTRPR